MHLLHIFPSFQLGGSQRRFAALANHSGRRYRHTVVSLDNCREAASLLETDVPCTIVPAPPKGNLFRTVARARGLIGGLTPDVLVTYNWGSMEWAAANLFCGIRHIHIEDGFGPEEAHGQLFRRVLFRRLVLNLRSTLVLPSQTLVNIATQTWRIAPKRVTFVPNGIACARFREAAKGGRGLGGDRVPVIGTIATLRKEKALDRLIHAFDELRQSQPARLVIVGDGPERSSLEALTASCGLSDHITFTGSLSRPEEAVGDFNIFAISSDTEQMPLSVLEAMAAGLPVAATDVGDIRTMVAEQNAPFIVAKNASALAIAMGILLKDGHLSQRIGAANRTRAELEYDEAQMFLRYDRLYSGQA